MASQRAGIDPKRAFPFVLGTEGMRQGTKSLRSSPLRGGVSREAGSKPIG